MNECSTVVRALPLRQNYRQRLWWKSAIIICSVGVLILIILSVVRRLLLVEQQVFGSIMSQLQVPSTDTPNTNGLLVVGVQFHQDEHLLN